MSNIDSDISDHDENTLNKIKKDLNLNSSPKRKFIYYEQSQLEENERNLPTKDKIEFAEVMKNFNTGGSLLSETHQAKLKQNIKRFVKNQNKEKVEIQFNDTNTKVLERSENYKNIVNELSKYQEKVKINREADILDFTADKNISNSTTIRAIANINEANANHTEKMIKDILIKNKCDTEDKIIENENKLLINIDPVELKKRYEELKRIKFLLFQHELDNKRKSKIKSKLFHKIKKKQREREEQEILKQLQEVDPEGVQNYLEKKKMDRIKERIELKHSFNSKFNKTVKRYHLQDDLEVKEAIKENFKLRDQLLKKIRGDDEDEDEDEDEEEDGDEAGDNGSEKEVNNEEDIEKGEDEEAEKDETNEGKNLSDEESSNAKETLLLNFNEKEKEPSGEERGNSKAPKDSGLFSMKFMQKAQESLQAKLKEVRNKIDSDDEPFNEGEIEEENFTKKTTIHNSNEEKIGKAAVALENKKSNNPTSALPKTLTKKTIEDISQETKHFLSNSGNLDPSSKMKIEPEDLNKMIQENNLDDDQENFTKFLIQNDENKKEFLGEKIEKKEINQPGKIGEQLIGWGSWAGDSKPIKAKEFLKKKRYQDRQKKLEKIKEDPNANPYVKINTSFDKNYTNYLIKELPNNISSCEEFEKLNSRALGKEWNSLTMYKKLIQPSVVKKIGQIIEPMRINDTTSAKKLCEIIEKASKKKQRTKAKL